MTQTLTKPIERWSDAERKAKLQEVQDRYWEALKKGLALDMTRGKPSPEQLDLSAPLFEHVTSTDCLAADGTDCRNYGVLEGLPEARALFSHYFEVTPQETLVGGNSSLALFHDYIVQAVLRGVPGGSRPWSQERPKVLCPVPGYDRHFTILDRYGIEMVLIDMDADGPDVESVARLVRQDESIKGILCVPRHSNPTGVTYSDETVAALAQMKTAAADFRIFWDNAYAVHHLVDSPRPLANVLALCQKASHPDRVVMFGSTSKITLAGAGVALFAASEQNIAAVRKNLFVQTIGPDKLNQLRHVRFFRDFAGVEYHMKKHAQILRPKFEVVLKTFEERLGGLGVASWTEPEGGYFISVDTLPGRASRLVELAAAAGVKLTPAGATYPNGHDPLDRNLRLAPTFPSLDDLKVATELFCDVLLLASLEAAEADGGKEGATDLED